MRCVNVESFLSDYADGISDDRGRRIVERHIQLCHACHDHVLLARQLGQQLMRLSLLPLGINDRLPRMRGTLEQKLVQRPVLSRGLPVMRAMLALIVGVLGLLLLLMVVSFGV
jgi:anti-sigma factor RsiW